MYFTLRNLLYFVLYLVLITELLYGLTENGTVGPELFFFFCAKKVFWGSFIVKPAFHTSYSTRITMIPMY